MICDPDNPFTRNGTRKIAGLRKIRETVAKIVPGGPDLRITPHQGELWVEHEPSSVLLYRADAADRETLRRGDA
jgi:hypothetical protein